MEATKTSIVGDKPFTGAWLIVGLAALMQLYRLVTVVADNGETPFLSANDRSRWCTIATLIEDRSFVIDRLLDKRDRRGKSRTWYSIDMVRKPEADGTERYYSSKPPLLSVIYAAVCSPVSVVLNRRLTDDPLTVGRTLLGIVQFVPLIVFWTLSTSWIRRNVENTWGRWVLLLAVLFGTFLSTFANTLNNHLPAALCMIASVGLLEQAFRTRPTTGVCVLIGLFAGLTAAFELPALAWAAAVVGLLWVTFGVREVLWGLVGMAPVAVAFAVTNYIAYGDLQPPYAHREVLGEQLAVAPRSESNTPAAIDDSYVPSLADAIKKAGIEISEPFAVKPARRAETWEFSAYRTVPRDDSGSQNRDPLTPGSLSPKRGEGEEEIDRMGSKSNLQIPIRFAVVAAANGWSIHRWNDWYDYPKSYWLPGNKQGVDLGEPSRTAYAFHVLIGHHGIFSLTPFWILSLIGAAVLLLDVPQVGFWNRGLMSEADRRWWLVAAVVATSGVCLAFYLARPLIDRNYGGKCSGFRWQFWLIPAWLWLAAPAVEWFGKKRLGQVAMLVMLGVSVFSATYPWSNPWQHPWPYQWLGVK